MIQFLNPSCSGVEGRRTPRSVRGLFAAGFFPALVGVLFGVPATAQPSPAAPEGVVVSLTSSTTLSGTTEVIDEAALVRVEAGVAVSTKFHPGHWQGVSGDVPGDVDGLARRPGVNPSSHRAIAFTLLSDEGGFSDGDVLGLAQGSGFEVLVAETDILNELQVPGAAIDLDAIAFDDQARLIFSLQANLSGSVLGDVLDGDILRLESGGGVTRLFSEADVQASVTAVTGSTSSINDVLGVDYVAGDYWVSVQSPSAIDGSVFSIGATPSLVLDEADAGLEGAELDALMWSDPLSAIGTLRFSTHTSAPGDTVTAMFEGGLPGSPQMVLMAGNTDYFSSEGILTGFDGLYVDLQDPWLNMFVPIPVVRLDGNGAFTRTVVLPAGNSGGAGFDGSSGWSFQTIDLNTLELSAPFRIEL